MSDKKEVWRELNDKEKLVLKNNAEAFINSINASLKELLNQSNETLKRFGLEAVFSFTLKEIEDPPVKVDGGKVFIKRIPLKPNKKKRNKK